MAFIPFTFVPKKKAELKRFRYVLPDGGVSLSDEANGVNDGKCGYMCNMDVLDDRIKNRCAQVDLCTDYDTFGKLNGSLAHEYYGKLVFHAGTNLLTFTPGDESPNVISDKLPDKPSIFCDFMSQVYIYCDTRVYSLDGNFVFSEHDPDAPLIYESVVSSVSGSGKRTENAFNILAPRIKVSYLKGTGRDFLLPHNADVSRGAEVYKDGVKLEDNEFSLSEHKVEIRDSLSYTNERQVTVAYYVSTPSEMGFENVISDCTLAVDFGGNATGGTRIFFTGNRNKKGYYFKSGFLNPLYASADEYEIIGNGSENITALKKMYGNLIVFTEQSVFRMSYTLNSDGAFFSVKEISSEAGCDCPGSVQLIDNRVVFANSKKGIFIVDSTEENGEQNIKPISGNIMKGRGMGLCDIPSEALKKASSLDFDRKYMLFADGKAYIWDYDASGFSGSTNYSRAQERLAWYIYDGIRGSFFAQADRRLVSIEESDAKLHVFEPGIADENCTGMFYSGNIKSLGFGQRKHVCTMGIKLCRKDNCDAVLSLFGDGEKYYETSLPRTNREKERIVLRLPRKALYDFGFSISASGEYEIEDITFDYYSINV